MQIALRTTVILGCLLMLGMPQSTYAQRVSDTPEAQDAGKAAPAAQAETAPEETFESFMHKVGSFGPTKIKVRDQAELDLPEGYVFVPQQHAAAIMRDMGNEVDENFVGMIFPAKQDVWFVTVDFEKAGYIKDDDAKSWKAEELLADIKKGTVEHNKELLAQGKKEMEILGWIEPPHYDNATHRLVWSIAARDKGETDNEKNFINYRTMMLGRDGDISMVMVTNLSTINQHKVLANDLLAKLNFVPGKRYSDFNASTDHVAEYGLAALVAGVAAKKIGLFAVAAAFLAKFAKVILIALFGGIAGLRKLFGRKPKTEMPAIAPPETAAKNNETDAG